MEPKQDYTQQQQQSPPPQQPDQHQNNAHLDPRSSHWQFGLFDCFGDREACLLGCFLPCMLHGKTMQRIHDPSLQSHQLLNNECMIWCGIESFTCCEWLYNMAKRTEIREKYGIEGDGWSDCYTSYCCLCCALVQQDREVALRASHYAPVSQGYQGQMQGMQMPTAAQPPPQQQPMRGGIQDAREQGMPSYPHEGHHGQKQ